LLLTHYFLFFQKNSPQVEKVDAAARCKAGHAAKIKLDQQMGKQREKKKLNLKMFKLSLGGGKVEKMNLDSLKEKFGKTESWIEILKGETVPVPREEYLKKLKNHRVTDTLERMESKLRKEYQELIETFHLSGEEAEKFLKGDKVEKMGETGCKEDSMRKLYDNYKSYRAEKGEVLVKEAFLKLGLPGIVYRSVEVQKVIGNWRQLQEGSGLVIPRKKENDEFDLIGIFGKGDGILVLLCEVKVPSTFPWDKEEYEPNENLFKKAWEQLSKSHNFITGLLGDIPTGALSIHAVSAFPMNTKVILEKVVDPLCCLPYVICKEDLAPGQLMSKLGITPTKPSEEGFSHLQTGGSRLSCLGSLHLCQRETSQAYHENIKRLKEERDQVDSDVWQLLDDHQKEAIENMVNQMQLSSMEKDFGRLDLSM
jgi:hypothetical protein